MKWNESLSWFSGISKIIHNFTDTSNAMFGEWNMNDDEYLYEEFHQVQIIDVKSQYRYSLLELQVVPFI